MYQQTAKTLTATQTCPICKAGVEGALSSHFKSAHTGESFEEAIMTDVNNGMPDVEIGRKYGITFRYLEKIITRTKGINVGFIKDKKIKNLKPRDFKEETTTVWSFKSRGSWATHSGEYRGNWSPYIPRNVILKYSKPNETVLDYFCGAGTTAVEAKLLGRKCIAFDINEKAIELAKKNSDFKVSIRELLFQKIYEPELSVRDARDLSFLDDDSVDLICAHPPYTNIIHYTDGKEGDLSHLDIEHFLKGMEKVARESYRVLKPGRQCAILIGDMRRHKHVIPLGFELINVYLNAGFKLKELVIKRQHNCKTTGFWYTNSIKFNFLLLGHEYLPIFEKPIKQITGVKEDLAVYGLFNPYLEKPLLKRKLEELETSTVWIFPEDNLERLLNKNVIDRYVHEGGYKVIDMGLGSKKISLFSHQKRKKDLLFIKSSCLGDKEYTSQDVASYIGQLSDILQNELPSINEGGYYTIQTRDIRVGGYIEPLARRIVDSICFPDFLLKEIIVVTTENHKDMQRGKMSDLHIAHQYLLVYKRKD
jgi:DNA modification methylase